MPVTELACIHLKNNLPLTHPSNEALNATLREGIATQAKYTNARASILSQVNDPSFVYVIDSWDLVEQHMDEWIPSDTNQAILGGLSGEIELIYILHFDFDQTKTVPGQGIPYESKVVRIERYFVSKDNRDEFERTFKGRQQGRGLDERETASGWRVDGEAGLEFVVLAGTDGLDERFSLDLGGIQHLIEDMQFQYVQWEFLA